MRLRWLSGKVRQVRHSSMCSSRCSATLGWLPRHRAASSEARCRATSLLGSGEHPAQAFRELLAPGVAHHPEEVPGVVDLAPLVGGTLEVAGYGRLEAPVVVGDHQFHARKSSPLQGAEQLLVGGFALGVRDLHSQDLPESRRPSRPRRAELPGSPPAHPPSPSRSGRPRTGRGKLRLRACETSTPQAPSPGSRPEKRRGSWRRRSRTALR